MKCAGSRKEGGDWRGQYSSRLTKAKAIGID
jgi:hypothetical protein